jgi:large subunit ribosomal protein L24
MRLTFALFCDFKRIGPLTKKYANLPEKYIQRTMEEVEYKTPNMIQYLPYVKKRKNLRFTTNRPWTDAFKKQNQGSIRQPVFIEPIKDWSIFKGDRVEVLVGRDAGKHGIVSQVIQERNWVIVAGLNTILKRVGATSFSSGALMKYETPLLVTNQVALVDPSDNKPTPIVWRYTEDGERVRVSIRTGRVVPMPQGAEETHDYKERRAYVEGDKDTKPEHAEAITFQPELKTFDMDIMDAMGIKEDRIPKRTYWY